MAANGSFNEINNYLYTKNGCMPYPMPDDIFLPALIWKGDDNARVADINAVLNPYLDQTFVDFITGKRDINSEWDTYLSELDNMGSAEMVSIMQKTYDAMK
jgi:putative aldouronate transport system substrate-binding protein